MSELKPCPFRVHGERTASLTIEGEWFYNEIFMPCMRNECACFHENCGDPYCDRNGAYIKLAKKGGKNERKMSIDIERELDKFEAISKRWIEWCKDCKHSYRRKGDDDTMWCRLRKRKCPHLEEMEEE